jgi:OPA family glycerol-3-phosphate transporter-like MFS transporter
MDKTPARVRTWQAITVTLMVLGYSGYYLCRSNFSVTLPLQIEDLAARGMPAEEAKKQLGLIASWGVLAYAIGKFVSGGAADFMGGRRNFLLGMLGSVLFTIAFALGGALPLFTLAWIANRAVQSMGWVGMVKISARWFSFAQYGTVMGIISLSWLFGDAAARHFMGLLIDAGFGWRGVFLTAAGVLAALWLASLLFLRETPLEIGAEEPPASPTNLFGKQGEEPAPSGLGRLLAPLLTSPAFWFVCVLSLGTTLTRETFNTWTPTYFTEALGLTKGEAARWSALFPFFGGVSVLLAGFLSDRLGRGGRAAIIFTGLLLTGGALLLLAGADPAGSRVVPIALIGLIAFLMIGPYSYLGGAISLDFGGKQGSGTAAGIIDGVGYLGGVLAGERMAAISSRYGWRGAFLVLAGVAALSCLAALFYLIQQRRAPLKEAAA